MSEIGAHQLCWLLLQALFIIARVLPPTSITALRTVKKVFIATSLLRGPQSLLVAELSRFK
jgi:hypothetical protein